MARHDHPPVTPGSWVVCIGFNPCRRVTEITLLLEGTASPVPSHPVVVCETLGLLCVLPAVGFWSCLTSFLCHAPLYKVMCPSLPETVLVYPHCPSVIINNVHFHFQKIHDLDNSTCLCLSKLDTFVFVGLGVAQGRESQSREPEFLQVNASSFPCS